MGLVAVVLHADPELVATTWLRQVLGDRVGMVCTELPGPDIFADYLPIVQVVALPSPPSDRRVHLVALMQVITRADVSVGRPGTSALAHLVAAHFADMSGRVVEVPAVGSAPAGRVAVSTVRYVSTPTEMLDANDSVVAFSFTGEIYLRPLAFPR